MGEPRRPRPIGRRGTVVAAAALVCGGAALALGLDPRDLVPGEGGLRVGRDLLSAAMRPALDYEAAPASGAATPFLARLARATFATLTYAFAALTLALPVGLILGFLVSESAWGLASPRIARPVRAALRTAVAALRSVHELFWAVLLLAAMGLGSGTAVLALALPLIGTLAKVFGELLDECEARGADGLADLGARPGAVFLCGRLPEALPDMAAYAFYRLECSVRTSAVLGFFGFPTLGYHLRLSFEENHYREVWTYLYALLVLILLLEAWSAALRRRYVA